MDGLDVKVSEFDGTIRESPAIRLVDKKRGSK